MDEEISGACGIETTFHHRIVGLVRMIHNKEPTRCMKLHE